MSPFNKILSDRTTVVHPTYNKLRNQIINNGDELQIRNPRIDMYESRESYLLRISIPGVRKEDIKMVFTDNRSAEIKGIVKPVIDEVYENILTREIYQGPFIRKIKFPQDIDRNKVQFGYQGGILEVIAPKSSEDRS